MRARVLVAALVVVASLPIAARAEPRLELSGFVGVDWFGARSELGNSWAPEQVPGTSPVVGGRVGWLAPPELPGGLRLALEAELAVAPAFTGDSAGHGRTAYFAPVFEWRGQAVLRLARWRAIAPHVVLGAGGDTVASRSPFMSRDTDPIAYWGPGLSAPIAGSWQLRIDLRHGVMPARNGGATSTFELQLGIGTALGLSAARPRPAPPVVPPAADDAGRDGEGEGEGDGDGDGDGDGVPDRRDACPDQPAIPGGLDDGDDGCPAPDPDGDGVAGQADRCPDEAEDRGGFADDDGCPDPDDDGDGIADAGDTCPAAPESVNGWNDGDGCPDGLPPDVTAALATTIPFRPGHARVTRAAATALRFLREMLDRRAELRIAIVGHPERPGGDDLARRRAEAVKWYLVDRGIAEDRIVTRAGAVDRSAPVAFQLDR